MVSVKPSSHFDLYNSKSRLVCDIAVLFQMSANNLTQLRGAQVKIRIQNSLM